MTSSGTNLVMTVIGFSMSVLFIVFVCTRLICARIHLNASRRAFRSASRSDLGILERGLHGIEPIVIANFPTKKYGDTCFAHEHDAQCTVCLGEYRKEDTLRILPLCGHKFHITCIDIWLQQHSTCPVCRVSLRELTEKKHLLQPMFSSAIRCSYGGLEPLATNSCHCLMTDHGLSGNADDNCRISPIREPRFRSENDRPNAGDRSAVSRDGQDVTKHVESPSNP